MNTESHEVNVQSRHWRRLFPPTPKSVSTARREIRAVLDDWSVDPEATDTVTLVASELTTNAVQHGRVPGRSFEVTLSYDGEKAIEVEVADASPRRPSPAAPSPEAESGRGLLLVSALSDAWEVRDRRVGKSLWARVVVA